MHQPTPTPFPYPTLFRSEWNPSGLPAPPRVEEIGGQGQKALDRATRARSELRLETELRSEEHTSELQSRENLVCRLLLEKKKKKKEKILIMIYKTVQECD